MGVLRAPVGEILVRGNVTASVKVWPPTETWVTRAKARTKFVRTYIPKGGVGCELGVYCGDFTRVLLDVAQPTTLHLIDPWTLLGADWISFGVWGPTTSEALATVQQRYADEITTGRVVVHVADDLQLLPTFDDHSLDFAYVDTIHNYGQVMAELHILKMKVKPSGVIAGDDWVSDPKHPSYGVSQAVQDFADAEGYEILYTSDDDAQFAIRRA